MRRFVAVLGVASLVLFGGCGEPATWTEVTLPEAHVAIDLPGTPVESRLELGRLTFKGWEGTTRTAIFGICHAELSPEHRLQNAEVVKDLADIYQGTMRAEWGDRHATYQGSGYLLDTGKPPGICYVRLYKMGDHAVLTYAVGPASFNSDPDLERCHLSFHLTEQPPPLRGGPRPEGGRGPNGPGLQRP